MSLPLYVSPSVRYLSLSHSLNLNGFFKGTILKCTFKDIFKVIIKETFNGTFKGTFKETFKATFKGNLKETFRGTSKEIFIAIFKVTFSSLNRVSSSLKKRNRNLQTFKAPFELQALGISLFTRAASSWRVCLYI